MPIPILMPALSPTMEEGTLTKWFVKEGDAVSAGDVIAEIETDKATMEVEAVDEGVLGKILVGEGAEGIKVNAPIAVILEEGEDANAIDTGALAAPAAATPAEPSGTPAPSSGPANPAPAATPTPPAPVNGGERVFASPLARRLAAEKGLDLAAVRGSGPRGRIVKADVLGAPAGAAAPAPQQAAAGPAPSAAAEMPTPSGLETLNAARVEEVKLTGMRKTIAARLTAAKRDIPHYYLTVDCEIDRLLAMRKELNAKSPDGEGAFKISVNDFIVRAAGLALQKVPEVNSSWAGDKILRHRHSDIGVAVAIDGGLITPIIFAAETKGLAQIAGEAKDLAARAREKKLKPQDYEGGSFSISNLGMFGIREFTAVINPPHAAILAVGAGEARPVAKDGALQVATVMSMTLSCDHRVIDGAVGATFLGHLKTYLEDPVTMLL